MNILLLQLKRIGDLILTIPAMVALRQDFPDARIMLIVSKECADLRPAISSADRILVAQRNLSDIAIVVALARERFDYCIDFTRNDRSAFLAFLSRARKRIVSHRVRDQSKIRARIYNHFVDSRMRDMHTVDYNLALLEPLCGSNASRVVHLELPEVALEKANKLRRDLKIGARFIIFHPGSARIEKFWDPARWAEVINHAGQNNDVDLVLTSGPSRLEQAHVTEIKTKTRPRIVDLSGRTDLLTLAALIAQARLLVTVDSAPMHLATGVQTPQVVLFGPTNPFHWRPRESPALVLQGESRTPLMEFSPVRARLPMSQISTEAVIDAMNSLLSPQAATQTS